LFAEEFEQGVAAQRDARGMPAGARQAPAHRVEHEGDVGGVARMIGARKTVGRARAAAKVRHHHDPSARAEMRGDGLRVIAAAAALQAVEQDQRGRAGLLRQGLPIAQGDPARGGRRAGRQRRRIGLRAGGRLMRKKTGARPIEIDEILVRRIDAVAHEGNAVMPREERCVDRLEMSAWQPGRHGAGGSVELARKQINARA